MSDHEHEAPPPGHRLDCKLSLGGKFCTCDYWKRKDQDKLAVICPECGAPQPGPHTADCRFGKITEQRNEGICQLCGAPVGNHYLTCPSMRPKKAKKKLLDFKQKQDGTTWMVSVIGPDQENGSAWYSERAGKDALQAAQSYRMDDDNLGAEVIRDHPDEVLIVVIDQAIAPSGKQWHVHLFCIENGKLRRFPG